MRQQSHDSHRDAAIQFAEYGMRSAAYSLGYLSRPLPIWQNLFFENRSVDDPLPVFIEKMTSLIRELDCLLRPEGRSAMDPGLKLLAQVNETLVELRRRRTAVGQGEVRNLFEASRSTTEDLAGILTADMIGHRLLKEWFRFGCALGAFCRQLSENPRGPVPSLRVVIVTARRVGALDREVPNSLQVVASAGIKQTAEMTLQTLIGSIRQKPPCHDNPPLDLLYATIALDEEIRESLEWLPVATTDEISDVGQGPVATNGTEASDSPTQSPPLGDNLV